MFRENVNNCLTKAYLVKLKQLKYSIEEQDSLIDIYLKDTSKKEDDCLLEEINKQIGFLEAILNES